MTNPAPLVNMLIREEGVRLKVYDDATGLAIKPGMVCKGHPTIGVGIALDVSGITMDEALYMLNNRIDTTRQALTARLPCFTGLDVVRQHAVVCMAFQLGVAGTINFREAMTAIANRNWIAARQFLLESAWAAQTPARAGRVADMILTGQYAVMGPSNA